MKHTYSIHQLDRNNPNVMKERKMFESWKMLNHYSSFDFNEYIETWKDTIETDESTENILEVLFEKFNMARPENFHGHSMSVSDVVVLDGVKWYCDNIGFINIDKE